MREALGSAAAGFPGAAAGGVVRGGILGIRPPRTRTRFKVFSALEWGIHCRLSTKPTMANTLDLATTAVNVRRPQDPHSSPLVSLITMSDTQSCL